MRISVFVYVLIMALVTYLIRCLPFLLFKKEIKNKFIKSFLYYVPYSVLAAMTIPSVFYSTDDIISAAVGFTLSVIASLKTKSLIVVALVAVIGALLTSLLITYLI